MAHLLAPLLAIQASVQVPAMPDPKLPPVRANYSIIVARAVRQSDPLPIKCGKPNCTSWFLGEFDKSRNVAGVALGPKFKARLEMGSPFGQRYTLAALVERLGDGSLRIRAMRGFHWQTKLACFEKVDTQALTPPPFGGGLRVVDGQYCVSEK